MKINAAMGSHPTVRVQHTLRRRLLPVLVAGCFGTALANPLGPQVINGQASFLNQGNVLSVINTPGTIINWQSFSINPGELTRFIQQNANSAVLNRITGQDPSQILGALQSNGRVFLVNPSGILFGQGAQVDVNGLVASTLNISNEDFLNGKLLFKAGDKAGNLKNEGAIATPAGGQVILIAPNVENSGIITSPKGDVMLAAGHTVQLVDTLNPDLRVVLSAPENEALNLGQVIAQGGRTGIYGALVKQRGVVNADSAVVGENGKVVLKASRDTLLEAGSRTTARGAGKGGEIQVLGERVGLFGNASVDASGEQGGGTVLIGGDYQGKNLAVQNAKMVYVGKDTEIKADAMKNGDGGKIIVWSDELTRFLGKGSVRGGDAGGNGGFAEVSGKQTLDMSGDVDLRAPLGKAGTILLDPLNLTIAAANPNINGDGSTGDDLVASVDLDTATNQPGVNSVITAGSMNSLLNSGNLTLAASNDITWNSGAALNYTGAASTLSLHAGNTIDFQGAISSTNPLHVNFFSNYDAVGTGAIKVVGNITTGGGNVVLGAGTAGTAAAAGTGTVPNGVLVTGTVNTGTGNITVRGTGMGGMTQISGIEVSGGTLQTTSGNITMLGTGGAGTSYSSGVNISAGSTVTTASGSISIHGTGGASGTTGPGNSGVTMSNGSVVSSTGAGTVGLISIYGNGAGSNSSPGVNIMSSSRVQTVDAPVSIQGFASNTGTGGMDGVRIQSSGTPAAATEVKSTGTGTITISGTAGTGGGDGLAITGVVDNADVLISSATAAINLSGYATGTGSGVNIGISDTAGETSGIKSTSGAISILGNNTAGGYGLNFYDFSAANGAWVIGGTGASGNIKITASSTGADSVNFNTGFKLKSTGTLDLAPSSTGSSIGLAGGSGNFNLSAAELSRIDTVSAGTFPYIVIGAPTGTGSITVGGTVDVGNRNLTLRTPSAGSSGIALNGAVNTGTGTLALLSAGPVTQTAALTANTLWVEGNGSFSLTNSGNAIGTLVNPNSVGNLNFTQSGDLTLSSLTSSGNLNISLNGSGSLLTMAPAAVVSAANVALTADRFTASTGSLLATAVGGYVWFKPSSKASTATPRPILIGGMDDTSASGKLELSSDELNLVNVGSTGIIAIGDIPATTNVSTGAITISADPVFNSSMVGTLALTTPSSISQTAALTVGKLAVTARQGAMLDSAENVVDKIAATIGKAGSSSTENQNFFFKAHSQLTVDSINLSALGTGFGVINGISSAIPLSNSYHPTTNNGGTIFLESVNGGISQASAATTLGGAAVGAKAYGNIDLATAPNPTGIIAGKSLFGNYKYKSASPILTSTVSTLSGIEANNGSVDINSASSITLNGSIYAGGTALPGVSTLTVQNTSGNIVLHNAQVIASGGNADIIAAGSIYIEATTGDSYIKGNPDVNLTTGGDIWFSASPGHLAYVSPETPHTTRITFNNSAGKIYFNGSRASTTHTSDMGFFYNGGPSDGTPAVLNSNLYLTGGDPYNLVTAPVASGGGGTTAPLPTLTDCTSNPALSGCASVLPTLATCTTAPSTAGCSAVLPTVDACVTNPAQSGCTAVLPALSTCTTAPATAGCSVVLPSLSTCTSAPTTAGCAAVLPTVTACTANPTQTGCTAVLPTLSSCTANPAQAGCSVILPSLNACISAPALAGCTAVLPTVTTCATNPTQAGCNVVLPTLSSCTSNPTQSGCSVVLPSMSACTAAPTTIGCSAVLPTLAQCSATPTLDGCSVVVPTASQCMTNPSAPECQVVLPVANSGPNTAPTNTIMETVNNTTNTVVLTTTKATSNQTQSGGSASGGSGSMSESDGKKAEKKTTSSTDDSGVKKNEPIKKMYCN